MSQIIVHRKIEAVSPRRRIIIGIIFLILAIMSVALFATQIDSAAVSTFGLTPGGIDRGVAGNMVLPTQIALWVLSALMGGAGAYQLIRGFGRWTNPVLAIVFFSFIFALLIWTAAGKSFNLGGLLKSSLILAIPIALGAFSGVLS